MYAHPGFILDRKLTEFELTTSKLAAALVVPITYVAQIISGDRSITADMACRLGLFFDVPPLYWLGLQNECDLASIDRDRIAREVRPLRPRFVGVADKIRLTQRPPDMRSGNKLFLSAKVAATERDIIEEALRESRGRIFGPSGAAAKLGVARCTLESKIRSLNINRNSFKAPSGN